MTNADEVEVTENRASSIIVADQSTVDAWWDETADTVEGYDLVKDAALFKLVGVPFKITKLSFRAGVQRKGVPWQDDFVSVELRIAPKPVVLKDMERILIRRSGKLITDKLAIADPGEFLVINDGSTGIYRQCVQYLDDADAITVGDAFPETGEKGESRYDLPRSEWEIGGDESDFTVALKCPRGLRYSDYDNPVKPGETAITWYIA